MLKKKISKRKHENDGNHVSNHKRSSWSYSQPILLYFLKAAIFYVTNLWGTMPIVFPPAAHNAVSFQQWV